jgi:hypothetical protein
MRALRIAHGLRPGYAAAVLAFAVDGLYLAVIAQQDTGVTGRVAFVAASIAAAGLACAAAESVVGLAGGVAAAWGASTLWIWTLLGALSIGLLGAPAGVLAVVALTRRRDTALAIALGIAAALLIAAAGLVWTPD